MAMVYQFRENSRFPVKPQVAGEEFERIGATLGGREHLTPAAVVEESRPDEAPLHPCLEWDDARAAELHREDQARQLIRSLVCVHHVEGQAESKVVQAYVHVQTESEGNCYMKTSVVVNDEELRKQMLDDALALLRGIQARFTHLGELREVYAAIDRTAMAAATGRQRKPRRRVQATA